MSYNGSKAQSALGALLSIGSISSGTLSTTFTVIGETQDIPFTSPEWKTESTTNLQSTIEEIIPTIPGLTNSTIKFNRVTSDAGQIVLETAYSTRPLQAYDFKLTLPLNPKAATPQTTSGDSWTWSAYVLQVTIDSLNADKTVMGMAKLQYVTFPLYTAGS